MYVVTVFQVYSKSNEWKLLVRWSISFCNETKVYDETDSKLLNLVSAVISFLHFVLHHHNKITKPYNITVTLKFNLSVIMCYCIYETYCFASISFHRWHKN